MDLEFSIDRSAIGKAASGDAIYLVAYCKNLDDDGGWGYLHRVLPGNAVADGTGDKTFSHYLGYVLDSGITPNAAAHQDCIPAPVVTSNADSGPDTLRQAIAGVCPGGSITFSGDTSITLSSGQLAINKRLTIDGGSQAVTVSGNNVTRVFDVGASGVVTLSHLSIVSGTVSSSGGGIHNAGALTVQDCVLSDNVSAENGGGIFNIDGVLTVQNSVLSGNQAGAGGGGIGNRGALTLQDSTLSGNSASYGGGIFNADGGQMMVYNSTLSGNAATSDSPYYGGGAIDQWVSSGSVSGAIINSTLVSNTAVSAHTSGIWVEAGELTLHNSIVAHNNGANNFYQTGEGVFTSQG